MGLVQDGCVVRVHVHIYICHGHGGQTLAEEEADHFHGQVEEGGEAVHVHHLRRGRLREEAALPQRQEVWGDWSFGMLGANGLVRLHVPRHRHGARTHAKQSKTKTNSHHPCKTKQTKTHRAPWSPPPGRARGWGRRGSRQSSGRAPTASPTASSAPPPAAGCGSRSAAPPPPRGARPSPPALLGRPA